MRAGWQVRTWRLLPDDFEAAPLGWNHLGGQKLPGAKGAGNDEFRMSNGELQQRRESPAIITPTVRLAAAANWRGRGQRFHPRSAVQALGALRDASIAPGGVGSRCEGLDVWRGVGEVRGIARDDAFGAFAPGEGRVKGVGPGRSSLVVSGRFDGLC